MDRQPTSVMNHKRTVGEALRQNVAKFFEEKTQGPAAACWFDEHLDFEIVIAY